MRELCYEVSLPLCACVLVVTCIGLDLLRFIGVDLLIMSRGLNS